MERKRIEITTVDEPKPVGDRGAVKYGIKGADGFAYFTFSKTLSANFQPEKAIEADVETTERQHNGNTYTDRKIVQIYVDGQPVSQSKGMGGKIGRSPDDRRSIETQVAVKLVVELALAGKLTETSPLYQKALTWIGEKLEAPNLAEKKPQSERLTVKEQANFKPPKPTIQPPSDAPVSDSQVKALHNIRTKQPAEWNKITASIKQKGWDIHQIADLTQTQAATLLKELQPEAV